MKNPLCLLLVLIAGIMFGQKTDTKAWPKEEQKTLEIANGLFDHSTYQSAYDKYNTLLAKHPDDIFLKYRIGICGVYLSDKHDEALKMLDEVYAKDKKTPNIDFYFACLYHKTYQFDKSLELINALLNNGKLGEEQKTFLAQLSVYCKNGKDLTQNSVNAKIENLGAPLNSENMEYAPVLTPEEETMILTYRGKESMGGLLNDDNKADPEGDYHEDIFVSHKVDGKWQKPESIGSINTNDNDAAIALSNDGQILFIYKQSKEDGGDIYMSRNQGGKWGTPEKLRGDVNSSSWEGSVSLSGDQQKLYFASERPGGQGGKDIYVAMKQADGSWGNVKNLGPKINTKMDEDAPFIHPDGRGLIFSSEGHNSMGDFDIFLSDIDENDGSWKDPVNVGYPINTTDDDLFYCLSADGKRGYYSSAKRDGMGDQDIYVVDPAIISKKSYVTVIKGTVTEELAPYECEITVKNSSDNRPYGNFKSNASNGHYLVNVPSGFNYQVVFYHPIAGEKVFNIVAEKVDGYGEKIINVAFGMNDTSQTNKQTVVVETKKDGETVVAPAAPKIAGVEDLINKYGSTKIPGLVYYVQVAATKNPAKYNKLTLKKLCKVKQRGTIMSDIHLLVADKEMDMLKDAGAFVKDVRTAGQSDAFITAEYQGKRYYLTDLIRMGLYTKLASN